MTLPVRWYVYLLRCADGSLYCGMTKDVAARVQVHNEGKRGAIYTRTRRPVRAVYVESLFTRERAMQRELQIKALTKTQKEALVQQTPRTARPPYSGEVGPGTVVLR